MLLSVKAQVWGQEGESCPVLELTVESQIAMGPTLFGDVIPGPRGPQEPELLLHLLLDQHDVLHNTFYTLLPAKAKRKKQDGGVSSLPNVASPLPIFSMP